MSQMVTMTINGREVQAEKGTTLLEAARAANIHIPSLCHNEELTPYGACRLCMVEIKHGKRTRLVASCIYEATEGLVVQTDTQRVLNVRKLVIELLLSRNPKHKTLLDIAAELNVSASRFAADVKGCILCGQCVRTCREVVGVSAISFEGRGTTRKVATPFGQTPPDCIACGSCAYICPVEVIPMKDREGVRNIWKTDFPLYKCENTGRYVAPVKQLEYFSKITGLPVEHFAKVHCK
jgi:bidirectional [NiFe] hydrogenase diaphorase subunit